MGDTTPAYPSLELSLPELLDFHYKYNPNFPLYVYAEDGVDKVTKISCLEFVRASHRAGKAVLGSRNPSPQREVIAVMAQMDTIVYQALNVGLMKAGFSPFPVSPLISPTAIISLLRKTSAHRLLTTHGTLHELVESVKFELSSTYPDHVLSIEEAPSLNELFPKLGKETLADFFAPLPALKPDDSEVALYMHSSGSTALPKAIPWTFLSIKNNTENYSVQVFRNSGSITRQGVMALPAFHALGIFSQLILSLYAPLSNVVFPPVVVKSEVLPVIPTPENVILYIVRTQTDSLVIVPTFLHVWSQSSQYVKVLSSLKAVFFVGGTISPATGDFLVSQGVNICSVYGTTEVGFPTALRLDAPCDRDWQYIQFSDRVRIRWVPQGNGTFECQFLASDHYHIAVENLADVRGYATLDVFEPHPTREGLWKYFGHADDVSIHSLGQKTVPAPMESTISLSPFSENSHESAMEEMIEKYSQGLDTPIVNSTYGDVEEKKSVVLLTGSTGNLGAQLLESLLRKDSIARVYALNRPSKQMSSMFDRHRERFEDKALDVSLLSSKKLVFLEGDMAQPSMGLSARVIEELRENLTMIIQNAWKPNFNLPLSSFEANVRGSRNLIELARSSRHGTSIRFLFTSSIMSTQSWDKTKGPYPEEVLTDARYAVGTGYGESKYVMERILAKCGLHATSFRIGQICGGWANGAWATKEWFPIIVRSSVALGILPNAHGVISWITMDAVSDAILDVAVAKEAPLIVNVVHPRPVSWTSMIEAIRSTVIFENKLPSDAIRLVSFQEWFEELQRRAECKSGKINQEIPAVKLVDFFRKVSADDEAVGLSDDSRMMESVGMPPLSVHNVQKLSPRVNNLESLNNTHVQRWVRYWMQTGRLSRNFRAAL